MYKKRANIIWLSESDKIKTNVIYALVFPNNKMYIGQTMIRLDKRIYGHSIISDKPKSKKEKAINLFKSFKVIILDTFDLSIIHDNDIKERYYIKKFNSLNKGYNSTNGGIGIIY